MFGNWRAGGRIWKEAEGLGGGKRSPTLPHPTGHSKTVYKNRGPESRREGSHQNQKLNSGKIFFSSSLKGKKLQTPQVLSSPRLGSSTAPLKPGRRGTGECGEVGSLKSHPWTGRLFVFRCLPLPLTGPPRRGMAGPRATPANSASSPSGLQGDRGGRY